VPATLAATVWQAGVDDALRAALDPGVPSDLDRRPDVLVVGGGAVGLATAAACVAAGLGRVVLIERERLAAGASGGAAAALSPELHVWTEPQAFVELGRLSLALYRQLDEDCQGALGLRRLDWLVPLPEPPRRASLGPGIEVLDAAAVAAAEPSLSGVASALFVRDQARLQPLRLAASLATVVARPGRAGRAGAVATGVELLGLKVQGDRVRSARTSVGELAPGALVLATGLVADCCRRWLAVPQRVVKGHLIATSAPPQPLRQALAAPWGLVLPLEDGGLLAGGTLDEDDETLDPRAEVLETIASSLRALIPAAAGIHVTHGWCCFRPATADRLPIIDRVPGLANAWVTAGHYRTGLLMAPAVGRALASWIGDGRAPHEVVSFGAGRFST